MDEKRRIGTHLVIIGFLFGVIETLFFGSNFHPESIAEWICDIMSLAISTIGWIMIIKSLKQKV